MKLSNMCGVVALALLPGIAPAAVVIGNFENSSDGWIDWGQGQVSISTLPAKYGYSSTGATLGSSALQLTQNNYNQNLAIKLQDTAAGHADFRADFLANTRLELDVTLPASTAAGYTQFYEVAFNAPGWGFKGVTATNPLPQANWGWGPGGGGAQFYTVVIDYSDVLAAMPANPGYIEIIFSTNNDGADTHGTYYIDNVRLTAVPEPSAALLAPAPLLMALRRRR